jgi:hypothetical protein
MRILRRGNVFTDPLPRNGSTRYNILLLAIECSRLHALYEPRYVIPCVGNITEGESCGSVFEFSTGSVMKTESNNFVVTM